MQPSNSVLGDCRAKVPDPPPPAIGREGVAFAPPCSFAPYEAMLDIAATLETGSWVGTGASVHRFTRLGEWVLITAIWYERVTGATMQWSLLRNTSTRPVLTLAAACVLLKRYPG